MIIKNRVNAGSQDAYLNKSFWSLVAMARSAGLIVNFLSDGLRLDEKCVNEVLRHGIARVAVSLDSVGPEVNEALRPPCNMRRGTTEMVVQNLRSLAEKRDSQLQVTVMQTVTRFNIDSVLPMIAFCRELKLDLLVHPAGVPITWPRASGLRLESCTPEEVSRLENVMLEWANDHEGRMRYTRIAIGFVRGSPTVGLTCPMGSRIFFLDAHGSFSPCFHRTDLRLGSVYDSDLQQIFRGAPREDLAAAPCASLSCACMLE